MTEPTLRIEELDAEAYSALLRSAIANVFDSVAFARLNESNAHDGVKYLAFFDEKGRARCGLIAGAENDVLKAPFSAPYAFFAGGRDMSLERWAMAVEALREYLDGKALRITLPPGCYGQEAVDSAVASLLTAGAEMEYTDYNFHCPLSPGFNADGSFSPKARTHLHRALREGLRVSLTDDVARAYSIIAANRAQRGFPLRMTLEQVEATLRLIPGRIFIASHESSDVAAAIIYIVEKGKAQLIYWGDLREYSAIRPMNGLAAAILENLSEEGIDMLDLGPSSSQGIPALGQCAFKLSTGARLTLKHTLILRG